ncbi:13936_t:CDS:2 [Funneliformis caledonium]|uniref:13936_t:CDS:1 n=1 Tax=Funneliformis caledonium TaxID=1117310 RepID=A0A9N9GE49_9GLOM|nr:13936_t:CDS:2 [Funneliformis caledonium]
MLNKRQISLATSSELEEFSESEGESFSFNRESFSSEKKSSNSKQRSLHQ